MSDEKIEAVLTTVTKEVIKNMIIGGIVTYDPETDSITITKKGLVELLGKEVIN